MTRRYTVQLTRSAERDLADIADYLAKAASPETASTFLDTMLARIAELEQLPERGAIPRELEALGITSFRQLSAKPWRIIYRTNETAVTILLIADGRRDMQTLLEQRLLRSGG